MEYGLVGFIWGIAKDFYQFGKSIVEWWKFKRPATKIFGSSLENKQMLRVYIKDLECPNNTCESPKLISYEGASMQYNPNIIKVWPEVEGRAASELLNLLGQLGKKDKLEIIEMSKGYDQWNTHLVVLGAQALKCREFYNLMDKVGYSMDEQNIYDNESKQVVERNPEYGYGLIIKARNPLLPNGKQGIAFLLGGFGTLGTEAAVEYFCKNVSSLGREFGNSYFSLVVRARIFSGKQSVTRIKSLDKKL